MASVGSSSSRAALRAEPAPRGVVAGASDFHGLVGRSAAMQRVFDDVRRLALGDAPLLIVGETGTGKELIARALHARSRRAAGPFVAVNCAALPRDLIESELFGHARGAFSGAATAHPGLFRAAAGGTVLLDEISEMRSDLQAKLLRVLQEHRVRPVGSVYEEAIDVRFLASSNRDLDAMRRDGCLRADLYYRLAGGLIAVPPLRHRGADIGRLAEHALARLNERYAGHQPRVDGLAADACAVLQALPWDGNVRELFNVVERAYPFAAGRALHAADLCAPIAAVAPRPIELSARAAPATMAESERSLIEHALQHSNGNKAGAARRLGISRKRLYARLARYGLRP
ncbi:MAG: sigma-54 interaction domain-containing protein [Candidatus Binatia bacterium]